MNSIQSQDPAIFDLLQKKTTRQNDNLELIAFENFALKQLWRQNGCTNQQICRRVSRKTILWWV